MTKGGARYGAGRPGYKVKAGQLLSLDIRKLARLGYTQRDTSFTWQWTRDGETTGSIGITAQADTALTLKYTSTIQGQMRDYAQRVELAYTACILASHALGRCARAVGIGWLCCTCGPGSLLAGIASE
jgi:hypothetical protein